MLKFRKVKKILSEYWEWLVGLAILLAGIVIGTSGDRNKVLRKDSKIKDKALKKIVEGSEKAIEENQQRLEKADQVRIEKEEKLAEDMKEKKEKLLKDSDKLDTILEEKYNLKGE